MKTERKTAPAALRRGMVLLCTLVMTLMAVTLPASAAVEGSLADSNNIGLAEGTFDEGKRPNRNSVTAESSSLWEVSGTTITGTVKPKERDSLSVITWGYKCHTSASSPLIITNNSKKECRLTFSYTVPANGTLSINGENRLTEGSYGGTLAPGASVTVKLTTPSKSEWSENHCQDQYTATAKLSNITLAPLDQTVSVEFVSASNGSYTAKIGSESLTIPQTCTKPVSTTYTLQATAADGYFFDGWYINNVLASRELTYTTTFAANSRVEARFVNDPLLYIIQMSDPTLAKSSYVEVDSDYHHNEKGSNHTNVGDKSMNNSYGPSTLFPDSRWSTNGSGGITSSTDYKEHGVATGDNQKSLGFSQAAASLYSDIIRVKCKENCIISFDSSMTAKSQWIQNSGSSDDQYGVFLYYYASSKATENANTIKTHGTPVIKNSYKGSWTNHTVKDSANGTQVVVNKGEYLYLYAYARTREDLVTANSYATNEYTYTATISNFTITPNNETFQFTTRNTDNTGAALAGGTVTVNGVGKDVSKAAYTADLAKGTVLTLTPGTAPAGYTFIGWHNATTGANDYTHDTYTVTMTQKWEVNPIYVPAMTITAGGANGYGSADYQYKSLSGQMVTPNGQFVARGPIPSSGGNPTFYTSLKDAFAATDNIVFLLAGDTFNGSLTIPKGKTLVIPDRFADPGPNIQTGLPEQYVSSESIRSYCKVTCKGSLTVEGTLVVNARQTGVAGGVCGRAAGGIGYLSLSDGSTVTVKNGGSLFGYGLIRGGSISAENGSTVRELMEISDMRAALVMKEIYDKKGSMKVFPFSNFSIKSIESRATYQTGAKLYAQYSVSMEGNNKSTGAAPLIANSGALFNLTKGSMTKYFDPATYKTVYRVDENSTMGTGFFQLNVKFAVGEQNAELTIDTKEYWMPLNAGFDLRTAGDMTVNGDFKFLPGASLSVEKGGKCTVANGKSLLFYRLNDYDTREIGNKIYQKGYSSKLYPVNATKLPDGPEPIKDLAKIGSARLNVDGEMIVNGGLYVSDELVSQSNQGFTGTEPVDGVNKTRQEINQAYFKLYPNGYNVLTGTGSINMTTALTNSNVNEAMTSQNTNDPAWAPIKITPIAGLKADAAEDIPQNYQPLKEATTYYGVYRLGGFYTWTTEKPVVAKIVGGGSEQTYRSLAAAVAAYDGTNGYIQMLDNSTEPGFTVDRNVTLDLNGKTVTLAGDLTVAEGKTLSGMDSSSKEYAAPKGKIVGKVTGTVAPTYQTPTVNEEYDRYVAISGLEADGKTANLSFHRFNISVTGYRFELATGGTPQCALFFIGKFQGDDAAKAYLSKLGFTLKGEDGRQLGTDSSPIPENLEEIPDMPDDGKESTSEVVRTKDGAFLFEAYLMRSFDKGNHTGYTEKIKAIAQATFKNNVETQDSEPKQWSFEDAWTNVEGLDHTQQEILDKFLKDLGITKQAE